MAMTHPNRTRNQSAARNEQLRKQSGDQHLLPEDEPAQDPHRPHRLSREDMEKLRPEEGEPGEAGKS